MYPDYCVSDVAGSFTHGGLQREFLRLFGCLIRGELADPASHALVLNEEVADSPPERRAAIGLATRVDDTQLGAARNAWSAVHLLLCAVNRRA